MKFSLTALPPKPNAQTLQFSKYAGASLPPPPTKVYWEYKVPAALWGMDGNDSVGDCTCAAIAHMVANATAHTGDLFIPSKDDCLKVYADVTGYDGTEATDNGAVITDILAYWKTTGIAGHKILAWAALDKSIDEVKQGIWLFGGVDIGITVYQSMEEQFANGQPWDNPSGAQLGGHSIPLFGYGRDGTTGLTWAALQQMGWATFQQICSEAYVVITPDWLQQGKTPNGFDLVGLEADIALL